MNLQSEDRIKQKMLERGIDEAIIGDFIVKARKASTQSAFVPLHDVQAPGPDLLIEHESTSDEVFSIQGAQLLKRLVVIKLNGGLSTTMGGRIPKGILEAKDGLSYLEVVLRQTEALRKEHGFDLPLILMNSFFTHDLTMEKVRRTGIDVLTLIQGQVPRLLKGSFAPLETGTDEDWVPPGHGDIYDSLYRTNLLKDLLDQGYKWAFISNLDNLAAYPDPSVLKIMNSDDLDFVLEVTDRTNADRKGGTPVLAQGSLELLEIAQVSPAERSLFQDILRYPYFNTNNLWIDLESLKEKLEGGPMNLPIIQNFKTIRGEEIIQIETAMGSALGCFTRTRALKVSRERFFPTKKISDLFVLRSDACILDSMHRLKRNVLRPNYLPFMPRVFFSEDFLDSPMKMNECFDDPASISLLRTDELDVYGPVYFEPNVKIVGRVEIRAEENAVYRVPEGAVLRDGRYPPLTDRQFLKDKDADPEIYPLELSRIALGKLWGSPTITWASSRNMPNLPNIGELWETFDDPDEGNVVLNGVHRLKPIRELIQELGPKLVGYSIVDKISPNSPFPLLIKYLFPSQVLSIQVHPDDSFARIHENSSGKTEMWLVLNAPPKSYIMVGWKHGFSKDELIGKIINNDFNDIVNVIDPKPGDVYYIPPGTIHALGPGISVLEIQQNSDITYRLYDWDRVDEHGNPRALHTSKALNVLNYEYIPDYRIPPLNSTDGPADVSYLCACRHFAAVKYSSRKKIEFNSDPQRFWVFSILAGQGYVNWIYGDPVWVEQGDTLLIPAGLGRFTVEPSGSIDIIKSWIPDLKSDIIDTLQRSGFSNSEIGALGGVGSGNDIRNFFDV